MERFIAIIVLVALLIGVSIWAAVEFSKPAPDWYEEEELYRNRWYK